LGDTGYTGAQGGSFNWKGDYNSSASYNLNDVFKVNKNEIDIVTSYVNVVGTLPFTGSSSTNTDGTGLAATINNPQSLCVDSSGYIYVACNTTIRKIDPVASTITTVVGQTNTTTNQDGYGTNATFQNNIATLEYNGSNIIYFGYTETVGDIGYVKKYNISTGQVSTIHTGYSVTNISLDTSGNIYVTCWIRNGANLIHKFPLSTLDTNGGTLTNDATYGQSQLGGGGYYGSKVLFDTSGNMYYTSFSDLFKYNFSSQQRTLLTSSQGSFDMILDSTKSFILYPDGPCIRKITFDGTITTYAGIPGTYGYANGSLDTAQFTYISAITTDINGTVYVSDQNNNRVRKIYNQAVFEPFLNAVAGTQITNGITGPAGLTGTNGDYFINITSGLMSQYHTNTLNPSDISGLQVWYDAADPLNTGTTPQAGTTISTWYDKSGNAKNTTSVVNGSITEENDGKPYLNFSGAYYTIPEMTWTIQSYFTFFIVQQTTNNGWILGCPNYNNFSSNTTFMIKPYQTQIWGEPGYYSISTYDTSKTHIMAVTLSASPVAYSIAMYIDGTYAPCNTPNDGLGTPLNDFLLANAISIIGGDGWDSSSYFFGGKLREILGYKGDMSTGDRQKVEGYLASKWGLQSSLPSSHPYYSSAPISNSWTPLLNLLGDTGIQGNTGYTGPQGIPGSFAAIGDTGYTGIQGDTGQTGPQGIPGSFAAIGDTGNQGATGSTGSQGNTGSTGDQGTTGSTGPQGIPGTYAAKGDTGDTGPVGFTGYTGAQGVPGSFAGVGDTGATGSPGAPGYTGATGYTGTAGTQIINGTTDPAGLTGTQGEYYINSATAELYQFTEASFDPSTISGLELWLDANDPLGTGVAPAIGTNISTWYDKSTNNNNAMNVGAAIQLLNSENGNYLNFVNPVSGTPSYYSLTTPTTWSVGSYYTIFIVESATSLNKYVSFLFGQDNHNNFSQNTYFKYYYDNPQYGEVQQTLHITPGSARIWSITFTSSPSAYSQSLYINGSLGVSGTNSAFNTYPALYIGQGPESVAGTNLAFNGKMFEVVGYQGDMSSVNRQKI
jgi:hypothetical protein